MSRRLRIITDAPEGAGTSIASDVRVLDEAGNDLTKTLMLEGITIEILPNKQIVAILRVADVHLALDVALGNES